MADIIDDAQAVNELHQEVSLRNAATTVLPEKHPKFDGLHCIGVVPEDEDCGDVIPAQRLAWGRIRCTACQTEVERLKRADTIRGNPATRDDPL